MATQVVMPKLSPTMEEGQVTRWLKKEGDKVSMGEPLAEIDTDKATMEMQALANGVLRKILIKEGESAPLGQVIAIIAEPDEDISSVLSQSAVKAQPAPAPAEAQKPAAEATPQAAPATAEASKPSAGATQQPTQPAREAATPPPPTQAVAAEGNGRQGVGTASQAPAGRLIVSPLAARMAAEAGIDLRSLNGSGPGGRMSKRDIE